MWNGFCQQVKVQQMHELKKKEKEYIKLQVIKVLLLLKLFLLQACLRG